LKAARKALKDAVKSNDAGGIAQASKALGIETWNLVVELQMN
jgi:hypothetical protein